MSQTTEFTVDLPAGSSIIVRSVGKGEGDTIVTLHGSGGGFHAWAPVAEHLNDHNVWLVARSGHHPSPVPAGPNSLELEAEGILAVLDAAVAHNGGPVHLVATSYGGIVALYAARRAPEKLRSLTLYEAGLFSGGAPAVTVLPEYTALFESGDLIAADLLFAEKVAQMPGDMREGFTRMLEEQATNRPDEQKRTAQASLRDLQGLASYTGDATQFSGITVPVLLLRGSESWAGLQGSSDELAAALPHAEQVILDGEAHFATDSAPDRVADAVRDFISRH